MIDSLKHSVFSECGQYRYVLSRDWSITQRPIAMCIGLNPSTANDIQDDQTISRLSKSLNHLGFGGFRMTNLYALISTKPKLLFEVPDAIKDNDKWLVKTKEECQEVIFCWGNFKNIEYRAKIVSSLFQKATCFGRNKNGTPWHPLAMMYAGMKCEEAKLITFK